MISISIKDVGSQRALQKLANKLRNRSAANRALSVQLYGWVIKNFEAEGALNQRWAPLQESTAKRKLTKKIPRGYHPILQVTGNLRQSFAPFADNDTAGVGARASRGVDYAAVHEEGAPSRNIPARPMLPPEKDAVKMGLAVYQFYVDRAKQESGL